MITVSSVEVVFLVTLAVAGVCLVGGLEVEGGSVVACWGFFSEPVRVLKNSAIYPLWDRSVTFQGDFYPPN